MSMETVPVSSGRRRAVGASLIAAESSVSLQPNATAQVPVTGLAAGYVRVSANGEAVHVTARETAETAAGRIGSGLPAIPITASLAAGESLRITGVDAASAQSVAEGAGATVRSSLMLIETTGTAVQARVTLRYTLATTKTTSEAAAFKDVTVNGGQALLLSDLATSIIGTQRDSLGDLNDMQVDVEVLDGGGRLIPVIASMDNGSGDLVVRTE
jgi:hypothetical protein